MFLQVQHVKVQLQLQSNHVCKVLGTYMDRSLFLTFMWPSLKSTSGLRWESESAHPTYRLECSSCAKCCQNSATATASSGIISWILSTNVYTSAPTLSLILLSRNPVNILVSWFLFLLKKAHLQRSFPNEPKFPHSYSNVNAQFPWTRSPQELPLGKFR